MIVGYDANDEQILHELLDNDVSIGIDVAKGEDECYIVTYTIKQGCDIVKSDSVKLRRK